MRGYRHNKKINLHQVKYERNLIKFSFGDVKLDVITNVPG